MADKKPRPSRSLSTEHLAKMTEVAAARKEEAVVPEHVLKPYYKYDSHRDQWSAADEHERKALIYGLVMFDGFMKMTDIARLFCVKISEIDRYNDLFNSAKMALKGKIQRNAISLGLQREDLLPLKFNLMLQYAEQTINPVHEGVEDSGAGKEITINVVSKEPEPEPENRAEGFETLDGQSLRLRQ
jgi:hypothetical protein